MRGSIDSIETLGLVDGPGIRCVVFLNGCNLRCKYCHNPEMWCLKENNYTVDELVDKIKRYKPYFNENGGVTFSGGEPLLQINFLKEVMKKLKKENINICLDTAAYSTEDFTEILELTDLVLLDIKHTNEKGFKDLVNGNISISEKFIEELNKLNKPVWIRQVIIPGITDTEDYLKSLKEYIKKIKNIKKIEFLPFHHMAKDKYKKLGIKNQLENIPEMDKEKCNQLYEKFIK